MCASDHGEAPLGVSEVLICCLWERWLIGGTDAFETYVFFLDGLLV